MHASGLGKRDELQKTPGLVAASGTGWCCCPLLGMRGPSLLPGLGLLLSFSGAVAQYASGTCHCPPHAFCVNGTCTCKPGYVSDSGKYFTFPLAKCTDIDECKPPTSIDCGPSAQCQNVRGGFYCHCLPGYQLDSGGTRFNGSSENTCRKSGSSNTTNGKRELQETVHKLKSLLNNETLWRMREKPEIASTASFILQEMESNVLEIALRDPGQKIQKAENTAVSAETRVVAENCSGESEVLTLNTQMNSMRIHCSDVTQGDPHAGPGAVAFISYATLGNILDESFYEEVPELWPALLGSQKEVDEDEPVYLNSQIVSAAVGPQRNRNPFLLQPVTLTLHHVKNAANIKEVFCVFWMMTEAGGHWSREGSFLVAVNRSHTTCKSTHLSSFAVLMAFTVQEEDPVLSIITRVGLSLSLLCLLLAGLTFLLCRAIRGTSTTLHLHLALCLFLAHLLFLTAIDRTEPKALCAAVAGALHFLYLAAFCWTLLEGLHLFLAARSLTELSSSRRSRLVRRLMFPVGYGGPAVVVAVSAACRPHLYGTPTRCWLQLHQGFVWAFLSPVCAIVCVNLVLLVVVLSILRKKLSSLNSEVSTTVQNTRMLAFKAVAQLFILGCTWVLGVLQVGPAASLMAYLFTVVNSLQGVSIFLVYCLLSQQVRKQYHKWLRALRKSKPDSEAYTLSSKAGPDSRPSENK